MFVILWTKPCVGRVESGVACVLVQVEPRLVGCSQHAHAYRHVEWRAARIAMSEGIPPDALVRAKPRERAGSAT